MDLYRISSFILLAAKVDNLISKYPEFKDQIIMLNDSDPTPQKKYLEYSVDSLIKKNPVDEIIDVINLFHKHYKLLPEKDISKWDFKKLKKELETPNKSKREIKNEIKTTGGDKIYEDDQCLVLHIKTKESACFYGGGTRWCITMKNEEEDPKKDHFNNYTRDGAIFHYILRKDLDKSNDLFKVASAHMNVGTLEKRDFNVEYYNASDTLISKNEAFNGLKNRSEIISKIDASAKSVPESTYMQALNGKIPFESIPDGTLDKKMKLDLIGDLMGRGKELPETAVRHFFEERIKYPGSFNLNTLRDYADTLSSYQNADPDMLLLIFKKYEDDDPQDGHLSYPAVNAIKNKNFPISEANRQVFHENRIIRRALASKKYLSPNILDVLSKDEDMSVRLAVVRNSSTSLNTLKGLLNDPDRSISHMAKMLVDKFS